MGPAALREARRAMNLAEELGLPLVTVIDTPGAELSVIAEERAVAGEIARCIATMTRMRVPTLAVLLGQGCGGGALALLPARRVLAAQHAWLSPLPPEGASVIVHGDTDTRRPRWPPASRSGRSTWPPAGPSTGSSRSATTDDAGDARPRGRGRVRRAAREHGGLAVRPAR